MKTFHIQTLGCKVNHYESEQIAALLRSRGLKPAEARVADVRVVHTCSVTMQAASQSRQAVRRAVRLQVLDCRDQSDIHPLQIQSAQAGAMSAARPRVIVTGCWATSDKPAAASMPGVDAVLGHQDHLADELDRLLTQWGHQSESPVSQLPPQSEKNNGWMMKAWTGAGQLTPIIKTETANPVNENSRQTNPKRIGTHALPLLDRRQPGRQRAFLKIQDGCDAHCTYCIIPKLRPTLWSKPIEAAVREAGDLVTAGHVEIVLTGIFLGAYGQPTALRRRQTRPAPNTLAQLIDALCTRVDGLQRLRLSSLEPGDLTDELLAMLVLHPQVVPHFHLPLQSGSDTLLRRMNRQYTRADFLAMIERVRAAFDRPALTTDVVVGFPGETAQAFEETVGVVRQAGFIHVHAFPYSPRPGTAAARWSGQFVRGPVVNQRIALLNELGAEQSLRFRETFLGQTVRVIVERDREGSLPNFRQGRCERYFPVQFNDAQCQPGDLISVEITSVSNEATFGRRIAAETASRGEGSPVLSR